MTLAEVRPVSAMVKSGGQREMEIRPCRNYCSRKRLKAAKGRTFHVRAKRAIGSSEKRTLNGLIRPSIGKSRAAMP